MVDNNAKLMAFISDVLTRAMGFAKGIDHIHMKNTKEGKLFATATADNGSLTLEATSHDDIDLDGAFLCLGNLSFLRVLTQSSVNSSKASIDLNTTVSDGKTLIKTITFKPNENIETIYVASDPFRGGVKRPKALKIAEWPVTFMVNEQMITEFNELRKIHSAIPSNGKEDILKLTLTPETAQIVMGGKSHTSSYELPVEVHSTLDSNLTMHFLSSDIHVGLKQADETGGEILIEAADKAIKITSISAVAEHALILSRRVVRDD